MFQYDDLHIKNIVSVKTKIIHLQLCFALSFHKYSNNVAYGLEKCKFEMKINDTMETKYYE